ncbi:hypothetical protein [Nitrobacter sp. TKz-YC01]|uniref:hypothetical protein n=1 Tax=Nitrobacter sp. TKz-YC01 TaxID=3398703 RepID=UPI003A0FF7AC
MPILYGEHDDSVWKMRRSDIGPHQFLKGGQVIWGRNPTRLFLNTCRSGIYANRSNPCIPSAQSDTISIFDNG